MEKIYCKICRKFDAFDKLNICLMCVRLIADDFELSKGDIIDIMNRRFTAAHQFSSDKILNTDEKKDICKICDLSYYQNKIENILSTI